MQCIGRARISVVGPVSTNYCVINSQCSKVRTALTRVQSEYTMEPINTSSLKWLQPSILCFDDYECDL